MAPVVNTFTACSREPVMVPVTMAGTRKTPTQTTIWVVLMIRFLRFFVCIFAKIRIIYIPMMPLMLSAVVEEFSWLSFSMERRVFLAL